MLSAKGLLSLVISLIIVSSRVVAAQQAQPSGSSGTPTFSVTSNLVYLDVTVLDKKGHSVTSGLTRDDFTITEEKVPQRIFSFEAPDTHTAKSPAGEANLDGNVPVTIFVLDLLNSDIQDASYLRDHFEKFLAGQPSRLQSPAELIVLGNNNLELICSYTRDRSELVSALKHVHGMVPYKRNVTDFDVERLQQSIEALQQISLQNKGVPGRKNVIWIGEGSPNLNTAMEDTGSVTRVKRYLHDTANMLVEARITLFVVYPPSRLEKFSNRFAATIGSADFAARDPFAGDVNFVDFVKETGGSLFYNRNDIDAEIRQSQVLGSRFYTLTYQPHEVPNDGTFKRIRVTLRNPDLRVVTKNGYFAPESEAAVDPRRQAMIAMSEATRVTLPINNLALEVKSIVQHPDSGTAELTVSVDSRHLTWQKLDDGSSVARFYLGVASLSGSQTILASKFGKINGVLHTQDPARLAAADCEFNISVRIPEKTKDVRILIETEDAGRLGFVDTSRTAIDSSPVKPTPQPVLSPRAPEPKASNPGGR